MRGPVERWRRRRREAAWRDVAPRVDAERQAQVAALGPLAPFADELTALLLAHDPIGLDFGTNPHEYVPEARTITLRLAPTTGPADVRRVVHEEFVRWFDPDTAGPPEQYGALAEEIWRRWQARSAPPGPG